jgi:hypothetical protein
LGRQKALERRLEVVAAEPSASGSISPRKAPVSKVWSTFTTPRIVPAVAANVAMKPP